MTPQQNIAALNEALAQVKAHCMCAKFTEVDGKFRVIYPPGFFPDGVQASQAIAGGKVEALRRMLSAMEKHWKGAHL